MWKKALKMGTYHTIRTQWNTFTVLICIKWEWWVLSLAWNIWIAESDSKQFNTWVELILNDHNWGTGECLAVCENLYTECSSGQFRQNSRSCSSVRKDFFFFQLGLQDKAFKSLNIVFETEYLSKSHLASHCSPYLIKPPTMLSPEHSGALAESAVSSF